MSYFFDVNISDLNIIARKSENGEFNFYNESRITDGFAYFIKGSGSVEIKGKGTFPIENGTLVQFYRGESYEFKVFPPCDYVTAAFNIGTNDKVALPRSFECTLSEHEEILRICDIFTQQGEFCYIEVKAALLRFYGDLIKRLQKEDEGRPQVLTLALSYLHKHYNENFSIEDVATACSVSPSHLRNSFHREMNCSVMQYRENLRVQRAKAMLKSGEFRNKEIADMLGYCDVFHFSKRFKQATGRTPAEYSEAAKQKIIANK